MGGNGFDRRRFLGALTGLLALPRSGAHASQPAPLLRPVPASGERLPCIGLGSWITFNVGDDPVLRAECAAVLAAFFAAGGRVIDSSPMYGSSQAVIGDALRRLGHPTGLFSADKVWTPSAAEGRAQIRRSEAAWGVSRFDLLQVHNLLSWEPHLDTLGAMKAAGEVRYIGITTSEGRRHREFERVMASAPLDFVQVTYNVVDREVEGRILPLARERGLGVLVNRPFRQGELTRRLARHPLPPWAAEIGAVSWAQVVLKFIVSHPAVTCAIPATTRVDHVRENVAAGSGPLPDAAFRARIATHVEGL